MVPVEALGRPRSARASAGNRPSGHPSPRADAEERLRTPGPLRRPCPPSASSRQAPPRPVAGVTWSHGHVSVGHVRGRALAGAKTSYPRALARSAGSRDSAGAAQTHVTGAAGRRVSRLPRAPQRPGLWTAGPSPSRRPPARPPASGARPRSNRPRPARLPLRPRQRSRPWRPSAALGGGLCSCCCSVRGRGRGLRAGRGGRPVPGGGRRREGRGAEVGGRGLARSRPAAA